MIDHITFPVGHWSEYATTLDGRKVEVFAKIDANIEYDGETPLTPTFKLSEISFNDDNIFYSEGHLPVYFSKIEVLKLYKSVVSYIEANYEQIDFDLARQECRQVVGGSHV